MPGTSEAAQKAVRAGYPPSKEIAWLENTC
jgi:hypothetical protein